MDDLSRALRIHEIAESSHRILNPLTDEKLLLLGEVSRLGPHQRQLDLCCGKGEMLCQFADHFGVSGLGVDISDVFLDAAHQRAEQLRVAGRVVFEKADASKYRAEPGSYDIVSCIGATWIGGGLVGTIELMRPALRPDGLLLVGQPYWSDPPPQEALDAVGVGPDDFASLPGTVERISSTGMQVVEMVLADGDSWDRYVAAQWWNVAEWLRRNPDHDDAPMMREYLVDSRRAHVTYQRRYLGWGVFVLRPA